MDIENFVSLIKKSAIISEEKAPGSRWYLFGSAARGKRLANDFDVLVVYEEEQNRAIIRKSLEPLSSAFPLHLFLMGRDEEHECQFIASQGARHIFG